MRRNMFLKPLQGRDFRERAYQCQPSIMLIIVLVNAVEQMSLFNAFQSVQI